MTSGILLALSLLAPPVPVASPAGSAEGADGASPRTCAPELFRIGRSKNANEVVYAARTAGGGQLDRDGPLRAEWHMLAEDGHREGLNFIENLFAYGFSVEPAPGGDGYLVVLVAKKDRPVHLAMRWGCPAALVTIAGREALLHRIFVRTATEGLFPKVAWADLDGVDPATGERIQERIFPGADGAPTGYGGAKGHLP